MQDTPTRRRLATFWRDERFLKLAGQILFFALVVVFFYFLFNNMVLNLRQQGTRLGYGFLDQTAGFDIAESLFDYSRTSTYVRAFLVGLANTLLVSILGIILATLLGIFVGVARLTNNFLLRNISQTYIEILRNIPLLVLLIFWYRGVFLKLPRIADAIALPGPIYLSNRGLAFPWGTPTETFGAFLVVAMVGLLLAAVVALVLIRRGRQTGRMPLWLPISFLVFALVCAVGWFILPQPPLAPNLPELGGLNLRGGLVLSPEFMALLSGLVIYTSAFIAEIVRAGIQSVSKGQTEAAHALGFRDFQTLRLVIFPQALRVMVPPLTSQYLNLTKNSSLAVAIAYPDLFYVGSTIINQSGRAVEMIALVMLVYLTISLVTALLMNLYNRSIALVER
jgi:general L-amino acid transport system permease protein